MFSLKVERTPYQGRYFYTGAWTRRARNVASGRVRGAALLTRRTGRWGIDTRFANSLGSERSRDARLVPIPKLLTPGGSLVPLEIVLVSVLARRGGQGRRRSRAPGCSVVASAARARSRPTRSADWRNSASLDKITHVVRLCIYLATNGDFFDQPRAADAASELFRDVFGEDKTSVRMVLGVASLPLGMPVAVEVILEVET